MELHMPARGGLQVVPASAARIDKYGADAWQVFRKGGDQAEASRDGPIVACQQSEVKEVAQLPAKFARSLNIRAVTLAANYSGAVYAGYSFNAIADARRWFLVGQTIL